MSNKLLEQARARAAQTSDVKVSDAGVTDSIDDEQPTVNMQASVNMQPTENYVPYEPVEGDYKALKLRQFYKANGSKVVPNGDGWYHPVDAEETEMLEYYEGLFDKVEAFA